MNENEEVFAEETTGGDGWDDISFDDLTEESEDGETADDAAEADQPEAGEPEEESGADESAKAEEPKPETDQSFTLKHLDETRTVNRDEVITLAQKGMDYDRIRERLDSNKEGIEWYGKNADSVKWLEEIAQEQGMTFEELVDNTKATIMAEKTKQSLAVCKGIVANERRAAELERQQKAMESKTSASKAEEDAKAKMQADIQAFAAAYPDQAKDPNSIPKEVWDQVNKGDTLLNAYRAYENKQLKAELEKQKQAEKNKSRSTGSQASRGAASEMDAFDRAWYDGD